MQPSMRIKRNGILISKSSFVGLQLSVDRIDYLDGYGLQRYVLLIYRSL